MRTPLVASTTNAAKSQAWSCPHQRPKRIVALSKPKVKERPDMKIQCPFCKSEACKVHQKNGHAYSTMYRCLDCEHFFSERRFTPYSRLKLAPEKII